ncbi:MAG TPA: prepilin-type N-terminal cleavage/methylation domain-containing protein [Armatimonadota bacterium]|jgi:prepilin-type N-terminal cleavage/methylation domain-containing protein
MNSKTLQFGQGARRAGGFSLIELLTVIAIIAVLMGLLFPVMVAQRKKAQRNSCASNLAEIAGGLRMYHLDNGDYPPALLGFLHKHDEGTKGDVVNGLWPHYVKSPTSFLCPVNPLTRGIDPLESVRLVSPDGSLGTHFGPIGQAPEMRVGAWVQGGSNAKLYPSGIAFPLGDSYDASILPNAASGTWERHYSRQWIAKADLTDDKQVGDALANVMGKTSVEQARNYARQLIFRRPDDSTIVTVCTYHRDYPRTWAMHGLLPPESTDVVLFLDGHVEMRRSQELNVYAPNGEWAGWQAAAQ